MYSDKRFIEFLNDKKHLRQKNQLLNLNFIWSKCYDLGN
jgi:hypothetical protein